MPNAADERPTTSGSLAARLTLVVLTLVFLLASVVAAVSVTAASTVRQPAFYSAHLAEEGIFRRLDDDLVPTWVADQLRLNVPQADEEIVAETADLAAETLSRAWFAELTDEIAFAVLPYLDGRQDEFVAHVRLSDRLAVAGRTFAARLPRSALARQAYDEALSRAADAIARQEHQVLPLGLTVTRETWLQVLTTAAPLDWVAEQVGAQVESGVAWLIGDEPTLAIRIPLQDQQRELAEAVDLLVDDSNVSAFINERVIVPAIREHVEAKVIVEAADISLTRDEIADALLSALTRQWLEERERDIATAVARYMTGEDEHLALEVPLAPLKAFATEKLAALVDEKLGAWFETLPPCERRDIAGLLVGTHAEVGCRPEGLDYERTKRLLGLDVSERVDAHLDERMPDVWVHDETQMSAYVSADTWRLIERARDLMQNGFVLTEAEVEDRLVEQGAEPGTLASARRLASEGWTLTDDDLRDWLEARQGPAGLTQLDQTRSVLGWLRKLMWPTVLTALVALLAGVMLAGGEPSRRLVVGGAMLAVGGAGVLLAGVWLRGVLDGYSAAALENAVATSSTSAVGYLLEAAPRIAERMTTEIVSTVRWIGGVGLGLGATACAAGTLLRVR